MQPLWGTETWVQYIAKKSYHDERTRVDKENARLIGGQISEHTRQVVANNYELLTTFQSGYDTINKTLSWGFWEFNEQLSEIGISIDSLRSDFNYNIAILIQEVQITNNLLSSLVNKLDSMHQTLQSPIQTRARELYNIGCTLAGKGLFDKALESLHKSEAVYDADYFTQLRLGYLYLFGVNDECNVVNLQKATKHLRLASRYAKANISSDDDFIRLTAETYLLVSISLFAQYGELTGNAEVGRKNDLLAEAKDFASQSIEMYPGLSEGWYHCAKYSALMGRTEDALENLGKAIALDRNYFLKAEVDSSFNNLRPELITYTDNICEKKKGEVRQSLEKSDRLFKELSAGMEGSRSKHLSLFDQCKDMLEKSRLRFESGTYFGYTDALHISVDLNRLIAKVIELRLDELSKILAWQVSGYDTWSHYRPERLKRFRYESDEIEQLDEVFDSRLGELKEEVSKGIQTFADFQRFYSEIRKVKETYKNEIDVVAEPIIEKHEKEQKEKKIAEEKYNREVRENKEREEYNLEVDRKRKDAKDTGKLIGCVVAVICFFSAAFIFSYFGAIYFESFFSFILALIAIIVLGWIAGVIWGRLKWKKKHVRHKS